MIDAFFSIGKVHSTILRQRAETFSRRLIQPRSVDSCRQSGPVDPRFGLIDISRIFRGRLESPPAPRLTGRRGRNESSTTISIVADLTLDRTTPNRNVELAFILNGNYIAQRYIYQIFKRRQVYRTVNAFDSTRE